MIFLSRFSLVALASLALLVACDKQDEAMRSISDGAPPPVPLAVVKIGHVAPMSGSNAHLGRDNQYGARMAIEELNAAGVFIQGQRVTLQLLSEDDAADPKQGTSVAQKLVDAKVSGVIGHLNSGTTIPASRIYSNAGIPQISPSATNPKFTRQGFKTAFRMVADDVHLGGSLGRYAYTELKAKTVAVIDDRTAYGQGVAEEFSKAFAAAGGKVVAKEFTTEKAVDFNAILTSIKSKKPDIIFFGGMDAVGGPMIKQMKSLGIGAKFMGGDGVCTNEFIKLAGPDTVSNGQFFCAEAGGVEGEAKAGMEDFRAQFLTQYNTPVNLYAPYVYDAVKVMVAAMVKANSAEPEQYLPVLAATTDFEGVTGRISFDEKGDIKNGALTLKTITNGKLTAVAVIR
jgi:branched-chain amino acid transport system substrate-binding protein